MTPIDLIIKEYIRSFFKRRMEIEKQRTGLMATGFVVRESEMEKFVDDIWVFINKEKMRDDKSDISSV